MPYCDVMLVGYQEALDAISAWVIDHNTARPHDSLGKDTAPAEARAAAHDNHNLAA